MKNDVIRFELRLSEMKIIKSALDNLEDVALKTFNESKFGSLEQIFYKVEAFKELEHLQKIFNALIKMKEKEIQDETK